MLKSIKVLLLLFATTVSIADDNPFVNTDVFELEVAANPQISPDGSQVAYARRSMDVMTDRAVSSIWIVDADGDNHRPLLSGEKSYDGPVWSPGGDRLAYVKNVEGRGPQIHVMWLSSGHSGLLTNLRHAPANIAWSPDGKQMAFTMFVPREASSLATPPQKPEGAAWAPPVTVFESVQYLSLIHI